MIYRVHISISRNSIFAPHLGLDELPDVPSIIHHLRLSFHIPRGTFNSSAQLAGCVRDFSDHSRWWGAGSCPLCESTTRSGFPPFIASPFALIIKALEVEGLHWSLGTDWDKLRTTWKTVLLLLCGTWAGGPSYNLTERSTRSSSSYAMAPYYFFRLLSTAKRGELEFPHR